MGDIGHCFWSANGDDDSEGLLSTEPVLTFATAISKGTKLVNVFLGSDATLIQENIVIPTDRRINIIGEWGPSINPMMYGFLGADDSNPIITLNQGSWLMLDSVNIFNFRNQPKTAIRLNTGAGIGSELVGKGALITLAYAGQTGLSLEGEAFGVMKNMVFQPYGAGPHTGSAYIRCIGDIILSKALFTNCTIVFNQDGGPFPASQICSIGGAVSKCKFDRCLWVEVNSVTGAYSLKTESGAYPPGIPSADKDQNPLTSFEGIPNETSSGGGGYTGEQL